MIEPTQEEIDRVVRLWHSSEWDGPGDLIDEKGYVQDRVRARRILVAMQEEAPIAVGDVVQIDPTCQTKFPACFAIVDEVRPWGVVAYVPIPGPNTGKAYVRLESQEFHRIGLAMWTDA